MASQSRCPVEISCTLFPRCNRATKAGDHKVANVVLRAKVFHNWLHKRTGTLSAKETIVILFGTLRSSVPLSNRPERISDSDGWHSLESDPQKPRVTLKTWLHGHKLVHIPMTPHEPSMQERSLLGGSPHKKRPWKCSCSLVSGCA